MTTQIKANQTKSFQWMLILGLLLASALMLSPINTHAQESDGHIFVLVHGAFQDASSWSQIIPILEANGDTVIAVNLPGRGDDITPITDLSLELYRDAVIAVIEAQAQPVILVGHSFGGMVISAVAEAIPDNIERLVYVAAYLPLSGESLLTISSSEPNAQDAGFIISDDGFISLPSEIFPFAFCPDCTPEQQTVVSASQLAEPVAPLAETVTLTEENFGRIPKTYILTAFDLAVSPTLQIMMLSKTPVEQVFGLQTGHVPYITASEALANLLIQSGISE
ncbi:MAG: alpha/beta fold hydrolase [Anaerolineae bacterium]|nr:alpha/beta fold hydrolase [Anaerolineae bacterium]